MGSGVILLLALDYAEDGNPVVGASQLLSQQMPVDPLFGFAYVNRSHSSPSE